MAVHSEPMTAYAGKDKVTEGDWQLPCMLHRCVTSLLWSVDNIFNSNGADENKIICIKMPLRYFYFYFFNERCFTNVITFLNMI